MKFGGTSVADPEKIKEVARRLVGAREAGYRVVGVLSAMGHTTDELLDLARAGQRAPAPARARHADLRRRADLELALRDGDPRPRPRGDLAHGLAGGDRHRHDARQGEDRRRPRPPHPRGARPGSNRARRGLPGRVDRPGRDDARARRLRHDRGRARRGARRRALRDQHRRPGRLHRRPPPRRERAQARGGLASRRCSRWRPPARP